MRDEPVVVFENVSKRYTCRWLGRSTQDALIDVSLQIEPGEVFGLLGPNQAGKTTVAKLLLSLCLATNGRILRFGYPVSDRRVLHRIGYLNENVIFPGYLTASELLEYYGALGGYSRSVSRNRASFLLDRVGLADRSRELISRFSKGMIQRLGIAQALINNPDLLVLDEPTEGLDLFGCALLHDLLVDADRPERTILLITHNIQLAERLCDRVAVLVAGRLVFEGEPSALPRKHLNQGFEEALEATFTWRHG